MSNRAFVVGVGMTKFERPGTRDWNYPEMVREAAGAALADANLSYSDIEQVCAGYVYAESTAGQRAVYELGMTGIPVINVNNNCATGSSALFYARQLVAGGLADCVLAVGFEKMQRGPLNLSNFSSTTNPLDRHIEASTKLYADDGAPMTLQLFGNAGRAHMERYGTTAEQFARVAAKNHGHAVNNPNAQFQSGATVEEILASTAYYPPLTKLQCSPTSDGAAAAIVCSERVLERFDLAERAVVILGQEMVTDFESSFSDNDPISIVGAKMTRVAAERIFDRADIGPDEIDVIELHDCFSCNELITYEALGLCGEGEGGTLIDSNAVTYGGSWVVNPSGGLIAKGHPLGATGLAQCAELTMQLRGEAGKRQVEGAAVALQHNIGLGGAAVVTLYAPAA